MTAYTAAAAPFPLESQNACRSKAWIRSWSVVRLCGNLSSPGHFPLNFSYCAFSSLGNIASQGRCQSHAFLKTIFPTKVTGLATPRGSYIGAKLLSTSLFVAWCESPEKVIPGVSYTESQGSLRSFASLVFTPNLFLAYVSLSSVDLLPASKSGTWDFHLCNSKCAP